MSTLIQYSVKLVFLYYAFGFSLMSFLYAQYTGTQETYICLMSCKRIKRMNYYMVRKLQQT